MTSFKPGFVFGVVMLIHAGPAMGQPNVEVWGAFSGALTSASGTLTSSYSPPLLRGTPVSSSAGQTLVLDGGRGPGFEAGINLFPTAHFGAQIRVDRTSVDLSGVNGPYSVSMQYNSAPPPFYQPVPVSIQSSIPWPDTTGSVTQLSFEFNAVARTARIGRMVAAISGGLSWYRISGTAQALDYSEYSLGGHSVLFSSDANLAVEFESTSAVGFDIGGDVDIALGRHAAILVGYRYLGATTTDVPVRLTTITNADQIILIESLAQIAEQMHLAPARIDPSGSRIVFGLKVMR